MIGPDLSTRRLLIDKVLAADTVKDAIADQARRDKSTPAEAWKKAHAFAYEIAADYSHPVVRRSEEHTSELQSLMRISYAVLCLTQKTRNQMNNKRPTHKQYSSAPTRHTQ